jgi:hypothetical protein
MSFCGGIDNAIGRKGGKCCFAGRTFIHKSVVECRANHRSVNNSRSTTKVDGDGAM